MVMARPMTTSMASEIHNARRACLHRRIHLVGSLMSVRSDRTSQPLKQAAAVIKPMVVPDMVVPAMVVPAMVVPAMVVPAMVVPAVARAVGMMIHVAGIDRVAHACQHA
jgi:hypothetical protein